MTDHGGGPIGRPGAVPTGVVVSPTNTGAFRWAVPLNTDGGAWAFARAHRSPGADGAVSVAVGPDRDVTISGWFTETVSLGTDTLVDEGTGDGLILRVRRDRSVARARRIGGRATTSSPKLDRSETPS